MGFRRRLNRSVAGRPRGTIRQLLEEYRGRVSLPPDQLSGESSGLPSGESSGLPSGESSSLSDQPRLPSGQSSSLPSDQLNLLSDQLNLPSDQPRLPPTAGDWQTQAGLGTTLGTASAGSSAGASAGSAGSSAKHSSIFDYLRHFDNRPKLSQYMPQILTFLIVAGSCLLVFWQLHPRLIFTKNTPTGGDMGAHVWGPDYLRDNIFSWWRLTGWAPDWYAGFPAFHFYMVVPYLLIAVLSWVINYGVAFKLVAVAGAVFLPLAAWWLGRRIGFRFPIPALFALVMIPFLFNDFQPTRIWGGSLPSLLAGEFAYSLSLMVALLAIAIAMRGINHGGLRLTGAVVLALVGLCHIIPAFFALGSLGLIVLVHDNRKAALRWLSVVVPLAGLLGAFWALPFWWRRDFFNDMGWEDNQDYLDVLLLGNYSNYWRWLLVAAAAGIVATMVYRIRYGWFLIGSTVLWAMTYRFPFTERLLNGRLVPFYYLSVLLLAALGAGVLLWRLFGGDTQSFFSARREGMRNEAPANYSGGASYGQSSRAQKPMAKIPSVPVFQFKPNVVRLKLRRLFTFPNAVFSFLGLALAVVVVDSYSGSWLAESGFEHLLSVSGAEAERLAQELASFSRILALGVLVLAGVEVTRRLLFFYRLGESKRYGLLTFGTLAVSLIMFVGIAIPLRALGPFGDTETLVVEVVEENGRVERESRQSYALDIPFLPDIGRSAAPANLVPSWANWNFTGYEAKPAFGEYQSLIETMTEVGERHGCGRAMWEYDRQNLLAYGTPMAPMLLPYWTDGCIGSMEGLYFESSATVPYHFLNQSELSSPRDTANPQQGPSRAMRGIPYRTFNIDAGIQHLQLFGVRYYLTVNDHATEAARNHQDLVEIDSSTAWTVFLITDSPLVQPLAFEPVVWEGIDNGQSSWLEPATRFYNGDDFSVLPAALGPQSWARISIETPLSDAPRKPLPEVAVTNIDVSGSSVSFSVDRTGVPVLVKNSYFPNWQVSGADGPWRVAPNLMVVVPTSENVKLSYGWTPVDVFAYLLTGLGLLIVALLAWRPSLIPWGRFPGPKEKV